ncbi:MAG: hypothetical protein OSB09_11345 [Planctomycetota bacterium]|nr:hypothetical protein [Planctomycetota bacterium]
MREEIRLISLHNKGMMLAGVEDPFADRSRSWEREQFNNLSTGNRVISLFEVDRTCVAIWTCYWLPRIPRIRFMTLGSELAYEYNHGFPVEKEFSVEKFPMSESVRELIEKMKD